MGVRKDGRLRVVVDCRRRNQHFRVPQNASCFSAGVVCADPGASMWFAGVHFETAFPFRGC